MSKDEDLEIFIVDEDETPETDTPETETPETESSEEDVVLEVIDDTPEEDQGRKPLNPEEIEELANDELEDYSGKVKNRLIKYKRAIHDERRKKDAVVREHEALAAYAKALQAENAKLKTNLFEGEKVLVSTLGSDIENRLAVARNAYKTAYENGDIDAQLAAQERIASLVQQDHQLKNYQPTLQPEQNDVPYELNQQASVPRPDLKAIMWQEQNSWYGDQSKPLHMEMTASAMGLHQRLVTQYGNDFANTDDYWSTIDQTMRNRFPEFFGTPAKQPPKAPPVNVAPVSRSVSPKRRTLTKSQARVADALGVSRDAYYEQLMKMEKGSN